MVDRLNFQRATADYFVVQKIGDYHQVVGLDYLRCFQYDPLLGALLVPTGGRNYLNCRCVVYRVHTYACCGSVDDSNDSELKW